MNEHKERPTAADIKVGDTVFIRQGRGAARNGIVEATVTKVARVWITLMSHGPYPTEYRFRKDTQGASMDSSDYRAHFLTLDQWKWDEHEKAGRAFLNEQGIQIDPFGKWSKRRGQLADILREHVRDVRES